MIINNELIENEFLEIVRAASKWDSTSSNFISVSSICREMKYHYGDYDKDLIEGLIKRLETAGTIEAEYLDGMLLGVKRFAPL